MNKLKILLQPVILASLVLVNAGCQNFPFAYKLDIEQGHNLTEEKVNKLEIGMLEEQVEFLLGSPLLKDAFHTQRWDYVYYHRPGNEQEPLKQHLAIYFDNGQVTHFTQDSMPETA